MDRTVDTVIEEFVCLNVQELPRIERKLEADDLIRETGATPPPDNDDDDEDVDFIADIFGT